MCSKGAKNSGERSGTASGGQYQTTIDSRNPVWNTDSAAKPNPCYEAAGVSWSTPGSLTVLDQPGLVPVLGQTWRATFKSYVICGGQVLREVTWVRSQRDGASARYSVSVTKTDTLPDWASKRLREQGYHVVP